MIDKLVGVCLTVGTLLVIVALIYADNVIFQWLGIGMIAGLAWHNLK